ncbi:hypothetical protein [Ammoniphilus sp. YIM 78166]|uniref:hypothetical protein n=1 Tax=Ammoniphilus sp. YIM 78166 TaxID=1644106 RepID=UPI00106FCAF0|nr:hypothetical protein [Ammoniphilus sp. YIM 78166]
MTQHIRTNFSSSEEAERARAYLINTGYEQVSIRDTQVEVGINEENWIAAYEILNGLGGSFEEGTSFPEELEDAYGMAEKTEDIPMVDQDSYIDMNLGYGDFEIIEPYILHHYEEMTKERED